jgi:hypothetical protein
MSSYLRQTATTMTFTCTCLKERRFQNLVSSGKRTCSGTVFPNAGLCAFLRLLIVLQVCSGTGPLSSNQKDPLQIADNLSLVEFGRDEAGLIMTTSGAGPPLLLPPEGYTGATTTLLVHLGRCKYISVCGGNLDGDGRATLFG